jgi:hypothetical protein
MNQIPSFDEIKELKEGFININDKRGLGEVYFLKAMALTK